MYLAVERDMPETFSKRYTAVKTITASYLAAPKKIALSIPAPLPFVPVDLPAKLRCELSQESLEKHLEAKARSNFLVKLALALLSIGLAWLVVGIVSNAHSEKADLDLSLSSMVGLLMPAATMIAGALLLMQRKSEVINRLDEFENDGFETKAMNDVFRAFQSWGAEQFPHIGFKLSKNRLLVLPEDIWISPDLAVILFGTEAQRRTVLNADMYALSSLVISEKSLNGFLMSYERYTTENEAIAADWHDDKSNGTAATQNDESLPLRKRVKGPKSKWSPRFRMVCKDEKYLKRYDAQNVKLSSISAGDDICHNVLLILTLNFADIGLIFDKEPPSQEKHHKAKELERSLKAALRIEGNRHITRYNDLIAKRWEFLERYIEKTGIISDEELKEEYPEVRAFTDLAKSS